MENKKKVVADLKATIAARRARIIELEQATGAFERVLDLLYEDVRKMEAELEKLS